MLNGTYRAQRTTARALSTFDNRRERRRGYVRNGMSAIRPRSEARIP